MAFTKSKNVPALKNALSNSGGIPSVLTDDQTQYSFVGEKRVINVYLTGTVTGQGQPNAELDKTVEAHIISTNAMTQPAAKFQQSVKI